MFPEMITLKGKDKPRIRAVLSHKWERGCKGGGGRESQDIQAFISPRPPLHQNSLIPKIMN